MQETDQSTLDAYKANGRYCMSGFAYGDGDVATCVTSTKIKFDNEDLYKPYACSPRDPAKKCDIEFEKTDNTIGSV